jgi:YesN/AraC family two-component response regulator
VIRVLVADDQAAVRGGFAALIDAQEGMQVAGEATNGRKQSISPGACSRTSC